MDAHLLTLTDQTIDHLVGKIVFFGIRTRITAITVKIASHGGAEKHCIRGIKTPLFLKGFSAIGSEQELIDDEVGDEFLSVNGIGLVEDPPGNGQSRMIRLEEGPDPSDLLPVGFLLRNPFGQMGKPDQIFLGGIGQEGKGTDCKFLYGVMFGSLIKIHF